MKIAIISDIHDNLPRLEEALAICKKEKIKTCICCGDISSLEIVNILAASFEKNYLALGNMDYSLKNQLNLFPENAQVSSNILEFKIDNLKMAVVHHDFKAKELAKTSDLDYIFFGHTHTPWEDRAGRTKIINPGELSGQFGRPTFAILDTKTKTTKLILLK